jgi:hypothetical protein
MRRQAKVLRKGGIDLPPHTFYRIKLASCVILLVPCVGREWLSRLTKWVYIALDVHFPLVAGVHLRMSSLWEGTTRVDEIT